MNTPGSDSAETRETERARLAALLPHRPPMLLLDALVSHEGDIVVCRVDIGPDSAFVVEGRVPAIVALEYMAQCVAVYAGLTRPGPPRLGYLVGVRVLDLMADDFAVGESLTVRATHVWNNEISASFEALVERAGEVVAKAKLSLFIPPEGTPLP